MSRLMRDGTAEPVSRDKILRHGRGQGNMNFPCSADHEQDWQPYPVDPYSAICDDHTYIYSVVKKKGTWYAVLHSYNVCFLKKNLDAPRPLFKYMYTCNLEGLVLVSRCIYMYGHHK